MDTAPPSSPPRPVQHPANANYPDHAPSSTSTAATPDTTSHERKPSKGIIQQLPSLRECLDEWKDLLPMAILMAIALPLSSTRPVAQRIFPVDPSAADLSPWSYPYREQIITFPVSAVLATIPPLVLFLLAQIRLKSYADLHASTMGLLTSLSIGTFFQVILKYFVGGLRPYFYDACKPSPELTVAGTGRGYNGLMFDSSVCTGIAKEINKSMSAFPSGHSNVAIASTLFVALYLNAKLKVFGNTRTRFWKIFCFILPLIIGAALCGSLTLDQSHNWYDILGGGSIGAFSALAAYRSRYAAIWDYRFNHIPLPRSTYLDSSDEDTLEPASFEDAPSSRKKASKRGLFSVGGKSSAAKARLRRTQRFMYDQSQANYPVLTRRWMGGSPVGAPGDAYRMSVN